MDAIPSELLLQILAHLCRSDLKIVRSVCRLFSPIAEERLYSTLFLTPNPDSFRRLKCISRHQRLSLYVRALLYSGRWLPEQYDKYETWLTRIGRCPYNSYQPPDQFVKEFTSGELSDCYRKYRHYVNGQKHVRTYGMDREVLFKAFKLFSNLVSVEFASRSPRNQEWPLPSTHKPTTRQMYQSFGIIARETLIEPDSYVDKGYHSMQFSVLLEAAQAAKLRLMQVKGAAIPWDAF